MSAHNGRMSRGLEPLPYEITSLHPGKHIIFSEDEQRVIGTGETLEEANEQARKSGVKGVWHYGYGEVLGEIL
jgi:hypothetical protein